MKFLIEVTRARDLEYWRRLEKGGRIFDEHGSDITCQEMADAERRISAYGALLGEHFSSRPEKFPPNVHPLFGHSDAIT